MTIAKQSGFLFIGSWKRAAADVQILLRRSLFRPTEADGEETMSQLCTYCRRATGRIYCQDCIDLDGHDQFVPMYCTVDCQMRDAPRHEAECRIHEKVLYRAADTLRKAFLISRELAFEWEILSVTAEPSQPLSLEVIEREDFYVGPVPDLVFGNLNENDKESKEKVYSYCACEMALGIWGKFLNLLLEGYQDPRQLQKLG